MNLLLRKKPAAETTPPLYSRPGRKAVLGRALAATNEMVGRFAALPGDEAARVAARLRALRATLTAERDRTVEPEVPPHWRDAHAREQAELGAEIEMNLPGARDAVSQFIARSDLRSAAGYAEQFAHVPLSCWERRHGGPSR